MTLTRSCGRWRVRGRSRRRWPRGLGSCCGWPRVGGGWTRLSWPVFSLPTVDRWVDRYEAEGIGDLTDRSHAAPREQVPAWVPSRILAMTRESPPASTGLSHWSSRQMADYLKRAEGV